MSDRDIATPAWTEIHRYENLPVAQTFFIGSFGLFDGRWLRSAGVLDELYTSRTDRNAS